MVLKLYGSAMATARVLVIILEKELPYELHLIDILKGQQKSADFMKLQPFGKVPALDDDGFILFESRAICRYLSRKYTSGSRLVTESNDQAYARFEQACSVEQSYFAAAAETIGFELVIKPYVHSTTGFTHPLRLPGRTGKSVLVSPTPPLLREQNRTSIPFSRITTAFWRNKNTSLVMNSR